MNAVGLAGDVDPTTFEICHECARLAAWPRSKIRGVIQAVSFARLSNKYAEFTRDPDQRVCDFELARVVPITCTPGQVSCA